MPGNFPLIRFPKPNQNQMPTWFVSYYFVLRDHSMVIAFNNPLTYTECWRPHLFPWGGRTSVSDAGFTFPPAVVRLIVWVRTEVFSPWEQNPTEAYTVLPFSWCLPNLVSILFGLAVVYHYYFFLFIYIFLSLHIVNSNVKGKELKYVEVWLALSLLYTCCIIKKKSSFSLP